MPSMNRVMSSGAVFAPCDQLGWSLILARVVRSVEWTREMLNFSF